MAWPLVAMGALGAIGGIMGARENRRANEAMNRPTTTTSWLEPWANVANQQDEAIRRYSDMVFNFNPSYFGTPPPSFRGGGGAGVLQGGYNQLFGQGGFGTGMQDFISGGLGQGNQFMRDAYSQTSGFSPYRLDQFGAQASGLAETPYIHQYIQNQGFTNPYEMMGLTGAAMGGFSPNDILNQFAPNLGQIGGLLGMMGGGFGGSGGGGGGGGAAANLGDPTNQWMRDQLEGKFLFDESNPYAQQMSDTMARRISDQFTQLEVPQLSAQFSAAGRYGSPALYDTMLRSQEQAQREIADATTGLYGQLWESERGRMSDAVNMLNQLDQQRIQAAAQADAAGASAGASRYASQMGLLGDLYGTQANLASNLFGASTGLYGNLAGNLLSHDLGASELLGNAILGYGDQRLRGGQLGLDAAMGATQADLDRLGLLSGLSGQSLDYDLGLLGQGNDLLGTQLGALGNIGSLRNQGAQQRYAADMNRWNWEQDRFNYMRDEPRRQLLEGLGIFSGLSDQFGKRQSVSTGPPQQYFNQDPWGSGISGLIGGLMTGYGMMGGRGGGMGGGGGGATNPFYGYPIGSPYGFLGGG